MNETYISGNNGYVMREDGQGTIGAGCGERDGLCIHYFTQQRIGEYSERERESSTLMARDYKSASDVVVEPVVYPGVGITSPQNGNNPQPGDAAPSLTNDSRNYLVQDGKPQRKYIVRRLTPIECARLQGFPDGWCEGLGGSDSAKYKAYGNGLALPCAYDVMNRIARFVEWENTNDNLPCNNPKESQEIP